MHCCFQVLPNPKQRSTLPCMLEKYMGGAEAPQVAEQERALATVVPAQHGEDDRWAAQASAIADPKQQESGAESICDHNLRSDLEKGENATGKSGSEAESVVLLRRIDGRLHCS